MDFIDYREKLGIGFDDTQKKEFFYTILFNALDTIITENSGQLSIGEYCTFCRTTGSTINPYILKEFYNNERFKDCISILRDEKYSFTEFLSYYIFFVNAFEDDKYYTFKGEDFKNLLCNSLEDAHIPYDLLYEDKKCFIFPKGAKELDSALVTDTLEWLKSYPQTHKSFVKALKAYSDVTEETASDTADLFRKTLETFFQEFFNTSKSLENLKSEYGTYMKSKGIPTEISNNLETLQQSYTNFMNGYAKHHDKTSKNVLEYIMYQTGNIIRLLITLKTEESNNAD